MPMKTHSYQTGDTLFDEGSPSRSVYRVREGHGEVLRQTARGQEKIGEFHAGEFIGEMGVLIATPRNATTRFLSNAVVEEYLRADFLKLIRTEEKLGMKLLNALSLRTRAQMELLARAPVTERRAGRMVLESVNQFLRSRWKALPFTQKAGSLFPASQFPKVTFEKGTVIFSKGDFSEMVYWIESGSVRIERLAGGVNGPRIGHIGKNEFLGEMGVLESAPRAATAVAEKKVVAYAIPPVDFFLLMKTSAAAYFTVLDSLCERARRLHRLTHEAHLDATPDGLHTDVFQTASSIDSMTQLAEQRFLNEAQRFRQFLTTQKDRGNYVAGAYQKYLSGNT